MTTDNLTPIARACIANARRALAKVSAGRRPWVPAEPEVAGERVQGEEVGE